MLTRARAQALVKVLVALCERVRVRVHAVMRVHVVMRVCARVGERGRNPARDCEILQSEQTRARSRGAGTQTRMAIRVQEGEEGKCECVRARKEA
eukprot:6176524-Pleurochrysis_carterae.AAC.2